MKNLLHYLTIILLIPVFCSITVFGQSSANIEGNWLGTLEVSGIELRLVLKVSKSGPDALAAKLDNIDQGINDLPIDEISQKDNSVQFDTKKLGLNFEGTLNAKGDEISGIFKQGANSFPLIFKRIAEIPRIARPQDPQKPYPYGEEEVSYENKQDGVKLAGTLTLPRNEEKHPAVILITGSGSQDRNETVVGHHPFLVLADYLSRRGIAVLRVDDRGVGGSSLGSPNATSENYAGDVLSGIEYLKSRQEINQKQIGLIGHSEGGMIAPLVAVRSKDVAFIVLLAGPGQTGEEIIYAQNELIVKSNVTNPILAAQIMIAVKNMLAILKSDAENRLVEQRISEAFAKQSSEMSEDQKKAFASVQASMKTQLPAMMSAWYRYFLAYNPRQTLEKVTIPVLALNGENDTQVSAKENLPLIANALKIGGNKDYSIKSFPKLNHLFQTSQTGLADEYGKIEETIAPTVLETISDWIFKETSNK
ncbi:MAG: alpha/beta hydrolase [Actinomycetota bacterium]